MEFDLPYITKNLDRKVPFHVQRVFTPPVCFIRVAKNLDNNKDPFHVTSSLLCLACQKSGQKKFHLTYANYLHPQATLP